MALGPFYIPPAVPGITLETLRIFDAFKSERARLLSVLAAFAAKVPRTSWERLD